VTEVAPAGAAAKAADSDAASGEAGPDAVRTMPGHLLRRCQQIAVSVFLDECRDLDLTPLQYVVLATLRRTGPVDQAALGGQAALDRTTVGVVVRKLEERGLIRRGVSARDRRSKPISITADGEALVRRAGPHVEAAQARMLAPLDTDERARFVELLRKMADGNNAESRAPMRL